MPRETAAKRVCFVTGTRAEFGLMGTTLRAIAGHPKLQLQIIVTGMHLDRSRGRTADALAAQGWKIDRMIPWPRGLRQVDVARATGRAMAALAGAFDQLRTDIVLVVGDRVEAFAAAAAAHVSGRIVAHVHGGDRAMGLVDDSLRHAVTKLAHVHLAATRDSAERIRSLGEQSWRIHLVGSPGIDGITRQALPLEQLNLPVRRRRYALLVLHPADADDQLEYRRAQIVLRGVRAVGFEHVVIVYPNNDPGAAGIVRCWKRHADDPRVIVMPNLPRPEFLGLLREAAAMVGNSSSGIIEAASFGTPVVDIGPRQLGRQRSQNVAHVPYSGPAIKAALGRIWNNGRPRRWGGANIYGGQGAGLRIAEVLARIILNDRLKQKLIRC